MRSLFLLLLLLFPSCGDQDFHLRPNVSPYEGDDGGIEGAGGVTGRICAPNGDFVIGAEVWVDHAHGRTETTTDTDGAFELAPIPPGPQTVHARRGSFTATFQVEIVADMMVALEEGACLSDLSLAVAVGHYDDIEGVLGDLGFAYTLLDGPWDPFELMTTPEVIAQYDIVFFNCGMNTSHVTDAAVTTLREYVEGGGSIYASDRAYWVIERAFPDLIDFVGDDTIEGDARVGAQTSSPLEAQVYDPIFAAALGGSTAQISFDQPDWVAVQAAADPDWVLVAATFPLVTGGNLHGPLAVRAPVGEGTVLYTAFHNADQTTADVQVLLREIVLGL